MRRNCHVRASGKNSATAVKFGDPDFSSGTDILAIGAHLPCDLDLSSFDLECVSQVALCTGIIFFTKFEVGQLIRFCLITFLLLIRYVTLWS